MQICKCTHIACTNTYTHTRIHPARYHTHTLSHTRTTTHTHDVALSPSLTLSWTHTHRTHSIQVLWIDSLNCFCSVDRAIEKIVRSYKSNISFVCDVARQVVVFDSISDMISMLRAIKSDPHIKIMRIKNRMSSGLKLCNPLHFAVHLITSSLWITPHHIIFMNAFIRQTFYPYSNARSNYNLKLTCEFHCFFCQPMTTPWHVVIVMFWSTCASKMTLLPVSFLNVCPFCVCVV